ncbi:MAG: hypothetical protein ABUL68_02620, partial [Pseudomonadota bacterium]
WHLLKVWWSIRTVHLPAPISYPQPFTEPPAMVRVVKREDVMWNRPTFKAPPLNVKPTVTPLTSFPANLRKLPSPANKLPRLPV